MQLWYACFCICFIAIIYGSDGEDQEGVPLPNGHHYDRNLPEIRNFLQQLDYTIYNFSQFSARVHQALYLEMFNFDEHQGRTLGDMLYAILREQRVLNESLDAQNAKLNELITQASAKDLITQATNGRFCNLENRMNQAEKGLEKLNKKHFAQDD